MERAKRQANNRRSDNAGQGSIPAAVVAPVDAVAPVSYPAQADSTISIYREPAMTDQHRATPDQISMCVHPGDLATDPRKVAVVINALSDRIEALEAAQLEQAESHRFCTDAIVRRVEALELAHRIQSGTLTSAERAELGVVTRVQLEAAMLRSASDARQTAMDELRAASAEAQPAGGLVERVRRAIGDDAPCSHSNARAAIREVAAWLRENDCGYNVVRWLEQEANQ
jgi:hypothetical protein